MTRTPDRTLSQPGQAPPATETLPNGPPRLEKVLAAMQDDLAHPWSVRELASIAYLSPTRLRQLFVEAYEMPPISWLTRQRVRTMAKLLCESDISVREAAALVGWSNQAHAAKQFRRVTGLKPMDYRAQQRGQAAKVCAFCGQQFPTSPPPSLRCDGL